MYCLVWALEMGLRFLIVRFRVEDMVGYLFLISYRLNITKASSKHSVEAVQL
jgi:hypothetical protein